MSNALIAAGLIPLLGLPTVEAQAAGGSTWVSGSGADTGACSFAAPCRTFQYAIDRTAAGGEINVKDSGAYGLVTITKSISIVADGALAEVGVGTGTTGVTISASTADTVVLRGLTVSGHGALRSYGLHVETAGRLVVDHCVLTGLYTAILVENSAVAGSVTNSVFSLNTLSVSVATRFPSVVLGNNVIGNTGGQLAVAGRIMSYGDNDISPGAATGGTTSITLQAKQ